ncbi:MAG: hypothetical protein ACR2LN_05055 [Candidatus Levyibacteriota bacterium]
MKQASWVFLWVVLFLLLGSLGFTFCNYVTAQIAGQGLEVSPPSQEAAIDPGKTITIKAKIHNRSNNTLPMNVHIEDFTAKGDQGQIALNSNSPYSIASWTKVAPKTFSLSPGADQEVIATITAPRDGAGGHFGSFVFSVTPDNQDKNAATVSQEIASLFLVKVSGPVNEKLTIKSFSAPGYSEFGPVPFNLTFNNSGNVYVKTFGLINVTDMFGKKVEDVVVPGTNVFPQADRVVTADLNKRFLFGNYTATALMYYGSQNQSITATTTFFAFPARLAAIVLVVLLLLFLMRKRIGKALKTLFG